MHLVLVHGTFDNAPDRDTPKWWEPNSAFARDAPAMFGDRATTEAFMWTGRNSEADRRAGGRALLKRLGELERRKAPYALVGHSHGGAVIRHALLLASMRKLSLPNLRAWTTVGTPFLAFKPKGATWARLGFFGQLAFLGFLLLLLQYLPDFVASAAALIDGTPEDRAFEGAFLAGYGLAFGGAVAAAAAVIAGAQRYSVDLYKHRHRREFERRFSDRWVCVWNENDEVLSGLAAAQRVEGRIVPANALDNPLKAFVAIALALTMLLPAAITRMGNALGLRSDSWFAGWLFAPSRVFEALVEPIEARLLDFYGFWPDTLLFVVDGVSTSAVIIALFAAALFAAQTLSNRLLGPLISRLADDSIWKALKARSYGNDVVGEANVGTAAHPPEFSRGWKCVPETVAAAVDAYVREHSGDIMARVQRLLGLAASAEGGAALNGALDEAMTWNELVHTTYFRAPETRRLILYATARHANAIARPAAENTECEEWYQAMKPSAHRA